MKNESDDFKKASAMKVIKFKVKWLFRILNYPFKKLESWM